MNQYYIFEIKKDTYKTYKNNSDSLYKTLYNLKNINKDDIKLGLSIYNEICYTINREKIKNYLTLLKITRNVKNKYLINKNIILIRNSCIELKTDSIDKDIIYILNNYSKYLFICNFKNKYYSWLNEI